ncbi:MAG: DUF1080 domain-containing protein [Puniceicoccales bacterium]|jgi:hypothetical protein|nr:DUF1080 domain-containing protein [Puniceicoccales bacterium]
MAFANCARGIAKNKHTIKAFARGLLAHALGSNLVGTSWNKFLPTLLLGSLHHSKFYTDMKSPRFFIFLLGGTFLSLGMPTDDLRADGATPQAATVSHESHWVTLFNGKDFSGWTVRGGKAPFTIENGEIVGTILPKTPNTFLCTEKEYGDFVLELEFNCHKDVNSGIQIRTDDAPEARVFTDLPALPGRKAASKVKVQGNHPSGYQVEIEPRFGRTAGIYDENRRNGWVYPEAKSEADKAFVKKTREIEKPGTWQTLRVEASGNTIRTYLDGVLRADFSENLPKQTGFIALQIHSAGERDAGKQVRFRNIKIKEGTMKLKAMETIMR